MEKTAADEQMMRRCLELAGTAEGRTAPNPMVGAVILDRNGEVAGQGFHPKAGEPHAEVIALAAAGQRAQSGTLYVNLEPCGHYGKTPPCTDAVIKSGVRRVVIGMQDPNPLVCGQGIEKLQAAGISVEISTLQEECLFLNRAFSKRIKTGLPWLSLKMAATLDGRIADRQGNSRWISDSAARTFVHELRNTHDCVLIGGTTAAIDNPSLTVRQIENKRDPVRAVMDPSLKVRPEAELCRHSPESESWTVIFSTAEKIGSAPPYPERVRLIETGGGTEGESRSVLRDGLTWLAQNNIQSVLCEGGGRLAAALLSENLVDEIFWIIAPKFLIDSQAIPALDGQQASDISACLKFKSFSYRQLGPDMLVRGLL